MNRKDRRAAAKRGDADALFALAKHLERDGRLEAAETKYREALAIRPGLSGASTNLGNILRRQGRLDEALSRYNAAILHERGNAVHYNNAGNIHLECNRLNEAAAHYGKAIALNASYSDAHNGLGVVLYHLGQIGDAAKCYECALALNPLNLLARINLGTALAKQGLVVAALDQAEIASRSSHDPSFPHSAMGELLAICGANEAARLCLETHEAQQPKHEEATGLLLAALGAAPVPERASDRHLDRLYAGRASRWDENAKRHHGYYGAALVAAMLKRLVGDRRGLDIIDAGCGTGLVGELLKDQGARLIGVDASAAMLSKAGEKLVYHRLHRGDLVDFLNNQSEASDVVTCAATLIHFGELQPAFEAAAACLRDQGLFILTLFPNDHADEVAIGSVEGWAQGGCFRHGENYVRQVAQRAGFGVEALEQSIHEFQRDKPVLGMVVALRRIRSQPATRSAA